MRNGGGGAQIGKRRFFYMGMAQAYGWGIKVVGRAPLRWPDRVVGASHRGPLVDQQLRRR